VPAAWPGGGSGSQRFPRRRLAEVTLDPGQARLFLLSLGEGSCIDVCARRWASASATTARLSQNARKTPQSLLVLLAQDVRHDHAGVVEAAR
jgi:hypothetical protein